MNVRRLLLLLLLIDLPNETHSQGSKAVKMADTFRAEGKIYVVVLGLVIILTGVVVFLIWIDRKVFKLEKKMKDRNS